MTKTNSLEEIKKFGEINLYHTPIIYFTFNYLDYRYIIAIKKLFKYCRYLMKGISLLSYFIY